MFTAPLESPGSIDNGDDVELSAEVVYKNLTETKLLDQYDAVLVACFSVHPLVHRLAEQQGVRGKLQVIGIFEAGILTALTLLPKAVTPSGTPLKWGIVTTGKFWEAHLERGVEEFLGFPLGAANAKFAGVVSTGLNAGDFHDGDPSVIKEKLTEAAKKLFQSARVHCVIMGCAGMAGLGEIIRQAAVEEYGEVGDDVFIIDGVRAGVALLEQTVRSRSAFL